MMVGNGYRLLGSGRLENRPMSLPELDWDQALVKIGKHFRVIILKNRLF